MSAITPTDQQQHTIDLIRGGAQLVAVSAYAGCGKTATLKMIAEACEDQRFSYTAFNRAIVEEAKRKMPHNVAVATSHSMAFRATNAGQWMPRINGNRQKPWEVAKKLGIKDMVIGDRRLAAGFLCSLVDRTLRNFTYTDARTITLSMMPKVAGLDSVEVKGEGSETEILVKRGPHHRYLFEQLRPFMVQAWESCVDPDGWFPMRQWHDFYLKKWQLDGATIHSDIVLLDEAQDTNPCVLDIIQQQIKLGKRVILVGDQFQQIYGWRGAVNAMELEGAEQASLSTSFRFGPEIAAVANLPLDRLGAALPLEGCGTQGQIAPYNPDERSTWLYRTNAGAVSRALTEINNGRKVAAVGGFQEVVSFASAADSLMAGKRTYHPDLACFDSWGEVVDFTKTDPNGDDMSLMVSLVEEFGPDQIIDGLGRCSKDSATSVADIIVSTAHKAKGMEWPQVVLAEDYRIETEDTPLSPEELRLLYVAATRAQDTLDVSLCDFYTKALSAA